MAPTPAYSFVYADFTSMYPAFASSPSEPVLQSYFNLAGLYVANSSYGFLSWAGATLPSLYMLTAHLAQIGNQISAGQDSNVPLSATIDKISFSVQQVQLKNQWQYWLNSTEYGKQLLALLQVQSVGGFYTPGAVGIPGRLGFRS